MIKKIKKIIFKCIFWVPDYVLEIWLFEVRSFLGRTFTGRLKVNPSERNLINLGCGPDVIKGFINIDFFFEPSVDYGADLRYPLRIDDNCIDGIFCEHTMEHLTYAMNDQVLNDCYRIMKPGAAIRIIVPDVSIFAENYVAKNHAWFKKWEELMMINSTDPVRAKRRIATNMQAISFVTQEYLHVACWDFETMKYYLEKNNFKDIKKTDFGIGRQKDLLVDTNSDDRKHVSLYIEATK
ncbi:MAG: methyltransferase domain-containing protein [Bacteroidetes bacterium]|nr:methyltransferase domain-containing protein [Bacteroidota bacterium]